MVEKADASADPSSLAGHGTVGIGDIDDAHTAQDRHFRTDHLMADLKGRSVRGGAVTMAAQGAQFVLQLGSTAILARLLTPADFGLIAMVTAVVGFVAMFKDAGLSMATVQREHITHAQVSTLFWINVALSAALMLVVAALAPAIAWFYGEPRLTAITLALALTFILGGLTVQHQALLQRQMRFTALSVISVASFTLSVAAALLAAWYGLGYWALVIMSATGAAVNVALVWTFSAWRPGRPARGSGVMPMLKFGGSLTGFSFLNYIGANMDNFLIGWSVGATALGFYSKAYNMILLPIRQVTGPLTSVAVPALSRLQSDPQRYRKYYCRALERVALITKPVAAVLIVTASEVVRVFLGPQWDDVVPIFRILSAVALVYTTNVSTGWVFTSMGATHRMLRWEAMSTPVRVLAIVIGLNWGALGVAYAVALVMLLLYLPCRLYCFHGTPIRMRDFFSAIACPLISSTIAAVLVEFGFNMLDWAGQSAISILACKSVLFFLAYVAVVACFSQGRQAIGEGIAMATRQLGKRRPGSAGMQSAAEENS